MDADIREGANDLDPEVWEGSDLLPPAAAIWERADDLHSQIGERGDFLDSDIWEGRDYLNSSPHFNPIECAEVRVEAGTRH